MRTFVLALLVGCAPTAMMTNAEHPANPDAPTGRLAGPPAALRPGVADLSKPTPTTTDHSSHGPSGAASEPEPEPAKPDETKSEPAKKPAEKPRKQTKPPASKKSPAETSTDTPKQPPPPAHQGHEGHH